MNHRNRASLETRFLVLIPSIEEAKRTSSIIERAGIEWVACQDSVRVFEQLSLGAAAVLIAEEAIDSSDNILTDWLSRQPLWSDLPVLVLARVGADSVGVSQAIDKLGNVTVLEQPMRDAALVSAIRAVVRARQRQYQLRDQMAEREHYDEQLSMAMEAANAGSWQVNLKTGEFSASDRAIELHGLLPGTYLDHERALSCVYPDDRESIEAALQLTFESGQPLCHEHRLQLPNGTVRWVSTHAKRCGEGDQTYIVGLVKDITERKEAESRLRASEEQLRLTLSAAATGLWEWFVDKNVITWSQECYPIHGMKEGEFDGTEAGFNRVLYPDDRNLVWSSVRAAVDGRTRYECEFRIVRPDGEVRWVANTGRATYDDDHSVYGLYEVGSGNRADVIFCGRYPNAVRRNYA